MPSFLMSIWMISPGAARSADRLGRLERRQPVEAEALKNAADGRRRTPTSAAICLPVWRCRRKASTAAHTPGVVWLGDECGLDERSRNPSTPSASNRSIHLPTVFGVVLNRRAAAGLDRPSSTTARTIISRPLGVKGAFLCASTHTRNILTMGNREPANSSTDELEALICARTKAAVRSRRRAVRKGTRQACGAIKQQSYSRSLRDRYEWRRSGLRPGFRFRRNRPIGAAGSEPMTGQRRPAPDPGGKARGTAASDWRFSVDR